MSKEALKQRSEKWLRTYCKCEADISYDIFLHGVQNAHGDDYVHIGGEDAHGSIPSEVWYHIEIVTGIKFDKPPEYFSCSC